MPFSIQQRDGELIQASENKMSIQFERKNSTFVIDGNELKNKEEVVSYLVNKNQNDATKESTWGEPTTFAELKEAREMDQVINELYDMAWDFGWLADNIIFDVGNKNKGDDLRKLTNEFADLVDGLTTNEEGDDAGMITRIFKSLNNIIPLKRKDVDDKESSGMFIWKDEFGTYRWVARYSNNLLDEDTPQEIISAESHEKFAELVRSGAVAPPELWLWHEKDWKWGVGEWVSTDKQGDITFAVAGGSVLPEFNDLAEVLMAQADDIKVSHGMPVWSIKRDADKSNIIVEHITKEISPLPGWAAANKFTGFVTLKGETDMALSKEEKSRLMEEFNVSPELISRIEGSNEKDAATAAELDIETKDADGDASGFGNVETEEEKEEATSDTDAPDANDDETPDIVSFMAETNKAMVLVGQTLNLALEKIDTLQKEISGFKENEERAVAEKAVQSPFASLSSMLVRSAVGSPEAQVDGRTSLAKNGPTETPITKENGTGIPFIDQMLSGS